MLEACVHQGAGLRQAAHPHGLRIVAMCTSPGGCAQGLELLWQVCTALRQQGLPVAVLDGTAPETGDAPGLHELLAHTRWCADIAADAASLAVFPAMHGLAWLRRHAGEAPARQWLQPVLHAYAVAVVYAPAFVIADVLQDTATTPLVWMPASRQGVLDAYGACKQLARTGLGATVVTVGDGRGPREDALIAGMQHALRQCAREHLGYAPATVTARPDAPHDMTRLATVALEHAAALPDGGMPGVGCDAAAGAWGTVRRESWM
ncbi:hypothetical protein PY257_11495 [Ramlibacter sp. H39-3-26]|uniref:hypothetical protein n=1 Tax=Curvibacter soli TaxID=3031331 RepID=UPI0023DABEC4|nr:hypothetical protein [Ramlibacter sp. H39-3-26]MDF1485795.1 hypothetical protein [Ramlibacter sp. H39-3-26]